jgi:hypothetical protein
VSRNLPASIRARLKQHADAIKQDFNLTLTHFGLERLLYRLSISRHANNYLLKGALLFSLWYDQPKRPTRLLHRRWQLQARRGVGESEPGPTPLTVGVPG